MRVFSGICVCVYILYTIECIYINLLFFVQTLAEKVKNISVYDNLCKIEKKNVFIKSYDMI